MNLNEAKETLKNNGYTVLNEEYDFPIRITKSHAVVLSNSDDADEYLTERLPLTKEIKKILNDFKDDNSFAVQERPGKDDRYYQCRLFYGIYLILEYSEFSETREYWQYNFYLNNYKMIKFEDSFYEKTYKLLHTAYNGELDINEIKTSITNSINEIDKYKN